MGMAALEHAEKMLRTSEENKRFAAAQSWLDLRVKLMDILDSMPPCDAKREGQEFLTWIDSRLRQV